ncbi:MAG: hypothetical protein QXT85_00545 [Nanopusillaceae archaeon]
MGIKFYITLLIFLILLLFFFSYTAFFQLSLQINQKEIICINAFYPTVVYENEIFDMLVRCENCGSISSEYYAEILIYNNNFLRRIISNIYFLEPSQYLEFSTKVSLPKGIYNVSIKCFSQTKYKESQGYIEVNPKQLQIVPSITIPSIPTLPPELQKKYELEIFYPKVINISQGDVINFFIKVINKGDTLNDLKLNISSELNLKIKYPLLITKLFFNETAVFLVELNVSYEITPKNYLALFCLISKEIEKCFDIEINVSKAEIIEKLEKLIDFYEKLIRDLNMEITNLELQGKNIHLAKNYLENASSHLLFSKNFFRFKLFEESLKELENVRRYINLTIIEISKLYLETIPITERKVYYAIPINLIIYILLIAFTVFLIFILVKKIRDYIKYRSLYSFKLKRLKLRSS